MKYEHDPKELLQALTKTRDADRPALDDLDVEDTAWRFERFMDDIQNIADDALKSAFLKTTRE